MKSIIFDTGPIISIAINNLLWMIEDLKKQFKGEFYITPGVYSELFEKPFLLRRFKLEALQVIPHITNGTLKVISSPQIKEDTLKLLDLANHAYKAQGNWIQIVQYAEVEAVTTALAYQADAVVIDERTMRQVIECPDMVAKHIALKTHTNVSMNHANIQEIQRHVKDLKVIRSVELLVIAYHMGLMGRYMHEEVRKIVPNLEEEVLEGALWALKLNGCSVSEEEISKIVEMEKQTRKIQV